MAKAGVDRPGRVRAFKPKVATGCKTCKIRRVKCDEAKPSCKRCLSTGRKCDGYFYSGAPSSSTPRLAPSTNGQVITITKPSIDVWPSLNFLNSNLEQRSFDFFHQNTIPQLSSIFGSPSWKQLNRLLLQAAYHEPAVRHAAVALGALHEQFEHHPNRHAGLSDGSLSTQFAVQQYVKALGYLVNPAINRGKPAADVALITCILFVCFENLRGEYSMALSHINGGVKIIEEIAQTTSTPISPGNSKISTPLSPCLSLEVSQIPYVPLSTLSLIFIEFDVQASGLVNNRKRALSARQFDMPSTGYGPDIPTIFKSVDEACLALDHIRAHGVRMLDAASRKKTPPDMADMRVTLDLIHSFSSIRLKQWNQAFDAFLDQHPHLVNDRGVLMLKMHRVFMGVNTAVERIGLIGDETIFDQYLPQFKIIVELCEKIIAVESIMDRPRSMFCLDTGIVICLFGVISKCRDGETRWKAVNLLLSTDRQEGLYHSRLTGGVAKRIIEIEEDGFAQPVRLADLPNSRRLAGVEVEFDQGQKRGTVRYIRRPMVRGPPGRGEVIEEYVSW